MPTKAGSLILTKSQAACLIALRKGKVSKPAIAIQAKLDLKKTATALRTLKRLALARQDGAKKWRTTRRGKICHFKSIPDRLRLNSEVPGSGGGRVLNLLDRPMRGCDITKKLGVSPQRVGQLLIKLHAQGHVSFGDPERPFWIVMRVGDKTPLLSREEERVLSVIPREYATDATKIRIATGVRESKVQQILERLLVRRLIETSEGLREHRVYRISSAGLKHPQHIQSVNRAQALRLPVESDRVRKVLATILDFGELRIRDVSNTLNIPHQSTNALMQYLKRKCLVKKSGRALHSPYLLTAKGLATLGEMTRREAA